MIKQYFIQVWAQPHQQPLINAVSITGITLAIFLTMPVVMMQQVKVVPFAPESNRDRFLHVKWMGISNLDWGSGTSSGPISVQTARKCFQSLKTLGVVTIYTVFPISIPVSLLGSPTVSADLRQTNDIFWYVLDFPFIGEKPYDKVTFDTGQPVAVFTESVVRSLSGTTDTVGREFPLNHTPYHTAGVVKNVSTLADCACRQVWAPYTSTGVDKEIWNDQHMGVISYTMSARGRDSFPAIRQKAERCKLEYNTFTGKDEWELICRGRPHDQEKNTIAFGANIEPNADTACRQRIMTFVILLIVPVINLSSMTQSRLYQRVSKIGIRRTLGGTRAELMGQIIAENLVATLLAGTVGLSLSMAFTYMGNTLFFAQGFSQTLNPPEADASILLHASTFAWTLLFCSVLNLMSGGFSAWYAARIGIVNVLRGRSY